MEKKLNNLKNTIVSCAAVLIFSAGSLKGQWTPGTGNAADTYWNPITNSVAIGINQPAYKLHVVDDNSSATNGISAGYFDYTSSTNAAATYHGIRANCTDGNGNSNTVVGVDATAQDGGAANTGDAIGFKGAASKTGNGDTYGGNFNATGGDIAYGLKAEADAAGTNNYGVYGKVGGNPASQPTSINSGVYGESSSSGGGLVNAGVYGFLNSTGASTDAAIYGDANGNSNSGVSEFAGMFNGDIRVNGDGYKTGANWNTSDSRLKRNVKPYENALEKLLNVKIYDYEYRDDVYLELRLPKGNQVGVLAQELEPVLPDQVRVSYKGLLHVNYEAFVPILIKAMQEQQQQIELLRESITAGAALNNESILGVGGVTGGPESQMEQNIPNPFTGETVINYNLTQEVHAASLVVYDLTGKQITAFELDKRGSSSYTLSAANLTAGMYFYSIIADGKIVGTKRMVIAGK